MPYFWILISLISFKMDTKAILNTEPIAMKDYLMGRFEPSEHPDFVRIPDQYSEKKGAFLRKEVLEAFIRMYEAALKDNITLTIVSATRNFDYQKAIWERKWSELKYKDKLNKQATTDQTKALTILRYSAMPGASRHHWGTDIDLCNLNSAYFNTKKGKRIYEWLQRYAGQYGFCQTYTSKKNSDRTGYNQEKWHWSYQPTSRVFTAEAAILLQDTDFTGFSGCETAPELQIVKKYILGINKDCF